MNFEKPKKSEFWKNEKNKLLETSSFYTCVPKTTHMRYSSWDPKNEKMKISEKLKKLLKIPSFYTIVPKIMIIGYTVSEIWHVTDKIVIFHFGLFVALLPHPPLEAQKIKFLKKWKNTWRYNHFTQLDQKLWLDDIRFLRYGAEGQKKWHMTYLGAPTKNICLINIQLST